MNDLIIIGGGAAGLGAALYAKRFALDVSVIAKEFGGTGNIAHQVDNWIGEPGIGGFDLMQKFIAHVKEYEVPMITGAVARVSKDDDGFTVELEGGDSHKARAVLFSNGMVHRKLGVLGEEKYAGKGVHYCYTCDGPLYRDKKLAVVGGSDSAALGSIFLAEYGSSVHTIFRREQMTAEPISVKKVTEHDKITTVPKANISEIVGDGTKVTHLKLDTGDELEIDGLFVEIGHIPLNELAKGLDVETDDHGFIKVDRGQRTNVKGIYAAGDITNATDLKQFITSAAEGSIAAQSIYNDLQK